MGISSSGMEPRVCEMTKQDFIDEGYFLVDGLPTDRVYTIFLVQLDEAGVIVGSTNPFEGVGIAGNNLDDLRNDIANFHQALEREIVRLVDLPGYMANVGNDGFPPVPTEIISPPEAIDDGSAPDVPGDVVEDQPGTAVPEPDDAEAEPDPDAAHDDPGEVSTEAETEVMANLLGAALEQATEDALVPDDVDDMLARYPVPDEHGGEAGSA